MGEGDVSPELKVKWEQAQAALCEEIGDLLMQPVFEAKLAEKLGYFSLEDAVNGIFRKLVRRHPHVFGKTSADSPRAVLEQWNAIKDAEKGNSENPDG